MEQLNKRMPERRMKMARMKKAMIVFCVFAIMVSNAFSVCAATAIDSMEGMKLVEVTSEPMGDGNILVTEIYEEIDDGLQTLAAYKTKNSSKIGKITSSSTGVVLVQMKLSASFRYNGTKSYCTGAKATIQKCVNPFSITKHYADKTDNKAKGYFTIRKDGESYLTKVISITCSANGTVS